MYLTRSCCAYVHDCLIKPYTFVFCKHLSIFTCGTTQVLKQGWLHPPHTPTPLKTIWKFFAKLVLPRKQYFYRCLAFAPPVLFAQAWHQKYFAPTHHQSCLSIFGHIDSAKLTSLVNIFCTIK